jgi:ankyrin repeat protein
MPAARTGSLLRAALGLAVLVALTLYGAWKFGGLIRSAPSVAPTPANGQNELGSLLLAAIRDGDSVKVQSLPEEGADVNARDETGGTALMESALYADVQIMRCLVAAGADVNAHSRDGATALLRAIHDPDKVRLLLAHGAQVDDRTVVAAARVPGSGATLEMLLAHGGSGQAEIQGYTALMAAAGNGDLAAARCLLEHGARVNARTLNGYTAVNGAAVAGNAEIVRLLLDRGADPGVQCELVDTGGDIQTPALVAASMGHEECLKTLLARGADVQLQAGPFERTALLGAATTGNEAVMRLLLARGVNVNAQDARGDTALAWAARRGDRNIVKLLKEAGARDSTKPSETSASRRPTREPDAESVRTAVASSLPLLQHSGRRLTQSVACITCHQHSLVAMTVGLARQHGFAVDETIATQEREHVLAHIRARVGPILLGTGIEGTLVPYTLVGLAAEQQPPNALTDALVHFLLIRQAADGRWATENYRPPEDASDFLNTALAIRGVQVYAAMGQRQEIGGRIARARGWLETTEPQDNIDRAFRLLGLGWAHAAPESIQKAAGLLLREQREDGGWSQLPTLSSDAYATGLALFALHEAGRVPVEHAAFCRGVAFLLDTQLADGSWFVPTRSFPMIHYTNSGFPHGRSQFISAAGSCWATMALIATTASAKPNVTPPAPP